MAPEFLTVPQAAEYLNCSVPTVWRLLRRGDLPGLKVGRLRRLRRRDLDAWMGTDPGASAKTAAA